jgi:hypothetical protein
MKKFEDKNEKNKLKKGEKIQTYLGEHSKRRLIFQAFNPLNYIFGLM